MKNLEGRKVKGFWFESNNLSYHSFMDDYIGEIGEIYIQMDDSARVMFEDGSAWSYPLDQIQEHLVPEYEIGKEYEFSDNGKIWVKRRLVGVIDHEFKYVSYNGVYVLGYKQIREIQEQKETKIIYFNKQGKRETLIIQGEVLKIEEKTIKK